MMLNLGSYGVTTLSVSDMWAQFMCGDPPADPNQATFSQMCADHWNKLANYPKPTAAVIAPPPVPKPVLINPQTSAPAAGVTPDDVIGDINLRQSEESKARMQAYVETIPGYGAGGTDEAPTPTSGVPWLMIGGIAVAGLAAVSIFTRR